MRILALVLSISFLLPGAYASAATVSLSPAPTVNVLEDADDVGADVFYRASENVNGQSVISFIFDDLFSGAFANTDDVMSFTISMNPKDSDWTMIEAVAFAEPDANDPNSGEFLKASGLLDVAAGSFGFDLDFDVAATQRLDFFLGNERGSAPFGDGVLSILAIDREVANDSHTTPVPLPAAGLLLAAVMGALFGVSKLRRSAVRA